jgi:beta-lactamase regulating signal transducer with metallopeptidase domain/uncharacterized GH25 family protein
MNSELGMVFKWLLHVSWQGAVLAVLVLAAQWLLQKKLSAAWRHALWLLVVARLVLPVSPRSAVSIFNLAQFGQSPGEAAMVEPPPAPGAPAAFRTAPAGTAFAPPLPEEDATAALMPPRDLPAAQKQAAPAPASPASPSAPAPKMFSPALAWRLAFWIWLAGVGVLAARVAAQSVLFKRQLRRSRSIEDHRVRDLFSHCARAFGIRFPIRLVATDAVGSPALYGWWRPTLLLPANLLPAFTDAEMRHVFLHELAHVKRRDMAVHWLATALSVLHWFNPVLWLAFRRMAADRELACDELALSRAGETQRRGYGETILKLLESCARPAVLPGVMGLLEDKDQMTRRITMIARFKAHRRWSALALLVLIGLACATLTDAREKTNSATPAPAAASAGNAAASATSEADPASTNAAPRPDLIGTIKTKAGDPLPKATIFIATAGPKVGSSTFCPSCYADCRKDAKSGAQGEFKIASLDPQLLFRILAAAPGYKPKYVAKVDPTNGPVTVTLDPLERTEAAPDRSVRGRIVDSAGKPVYGAVVEAHGIRKKNDNGTMWGSLPGVDPLAVTDENGEFLLTAKDPFESLDLRVSARAFADKMFTRVAAGTEVHPLAITEGTTVSGRVVSNGKPLPGVSVGLVSADRGVENFTGNFDVATDREGRFTFVNLPPKVGYLVYGLMGSVKQYGAIPARPVAARGDGETVDVGDLPVIPAHKLAGQVVLSDGIPVPARTRLLVSREGAWDSMQLELDKDGRFETAGLPRETVSLSASVKGYRLSARNRSLDQANPFQLVGRIEGDTTNLVILLEPGKNLDSDFSPTQPQSAWPQNRALHGTEGAVEHADEFTLSGQVRDKATGEPLESFKVTTGNQQSTFQGAYWDKRSATRGSNGLFTVYLNQKFNQPLLKIEADGYLPRAIGVLLESRTNLNFTLEKGAGPSGVVLLPDGKPAQGVSVALLSARQQDIRLTAEGRLRPIRNKDAILLTDPEGAFSFAPELEMETVVVAANAGFKRATVAELAKNPRLTLEPWATLNGVLYRGSKPGTNETLDLGFANGALHFLEIHATTDAQGRFEYDRVPPGLLQIKARHMLDHAPHGGWTSETVQTVNVKPGETNTVEIHAPAKPNVRTAILPAAAPEPKPVAAFGPPIEGTILSADGAPVAGMDVALAVPGKFLAVGRGALRANQARQEGLLTRTDEKGRFSLPGAAAATGIVGANEQGIAVANLATMKTNSQIRLRAWGRIEGTLRVGGALGTNELIALNPPVNARDGYTVDFDAFRTRTDDQGRFILTYVPPGAWKVARLIPHGEKGWIVGSGPLVQVRAGSTTTVQMGNTGRTVSGKVQAKKASGPLDWERASGVLRLPLPANYPKATGDLAARQQAMNEWTRSDEGLQYFARTYPVLIDKSGALHVEDVLPGKYELHLVFYSEVSSPDQAPQVLGILRRDITVPEFKNAEDHAGLDLGLIDGTVEAATLSAVRNMNIGAY